MGTRKPARPAIKPSLWLGFLLAAMWLVFAGFCLWQWKYVPPEAKHNLGPQQWVVAFAAITAMSGWIVASVITVRNTVKQHTISTLLQSRLSATYMTYADKVSGHYIAYDLERKACPSLAKAPTDGIDEAALRYILNYFEFIAIGIRKGDLDEAMMKDSLRSILMKNVAMSRQWIDDCRSKSPRLYRHLAWLHSRWLPEEPQLQYFEVLHA